MQVTFTESIDAKVVVTARLDAEGNLFAVVSGHCSYAEDEVEGARCSAEVSLPDDLAAPIRAALEAAREKVVGELGKRLAHSKSVAYKVALEQREVGPHRKVRK